MDGWMAGVEINLGNLKKWLYMKKYNHLWLNQLLFQNPKHSRYIPICILIRGKSIFSLGTHQQPSKGAKSFDLWFPASKWQWTILFGQLKCFDSRVANRIWQIYWLHVVLKKWDWKGAGSTEILADDEDYDRQFCQSWPLLTYLLRERLLWTLNFFGLIYYTIYGKSLHL